MVSISIPTRRLLWKELRQLLPLAVSTSVIWLLLRLNNLFVFSNDLRTNIEFGLFIGLPGLFAVGVGALLVGQEKEQRTIGWFCSLPVAANDLIRSKLVVGVLGLVVMWLFSTLMALAFAFAFGASPSPYYEQIGELATYPLHSLYLLLAGLAIAWRTQSSFLALAFLVPAALLPYLAGWIVSWMAWQAFGIENPFDSWIVSAHFLIPCQLVACLAVYLLGFRWAHVALGPVALPTARGSSAPGKAKPLTPILRPKSALIWQFAAQNQGKLRAASIVFVVSMILYSASALLVDQVETRWIGPMIAAGCAGSFFALVWMSACIFQSDSSQHRVRFLADRGVSPITVWWTRHAVPLSILILATLVIVPGIAALLGVSQPIRCSPVGCSVRSGTDALMGVNQPIYWERIQIVLLTLMAVGTTLYCTSQWVGQVFTGSILTFLVSPIFSLAALAYLWFCVDTVGTGLWLAGLTAVFPLVTTLILTKRWMDQRFDFKYWLTHSLTLVAFLFLPWIPVLITLATTSTMSRETMAAMAEMQRSTTDNNVLSPFELVLQVGDSSTPEKPEPRLTVEQKTQLATKSLRQQLEDRPGWPSRLNLPVLAFLKSELEHTRSLGKEVAIAQYNDLVLLALDIVERTRRSHHLQDQDMVDRLEIVLVYELVHNDGRSLLQTTCLDRAASVLGDKPGRDAARRFAVVNSPNLQFDNPNNPLALSSPKFEIRSWLANERRLSRAKELLWKLANSANQDTFWLRHQIASELDYPPSHYGLGPAKEFYRADDLSTYLFEGLDTYRVGIGAQWHADWEQQAQSLSKPLTSQNKINEPRKN